MQVVTIEISTQSPQSTHLYKLSRIDMKDIINSEFTMAWHNCMLVRKSTGESDGGIMDIAWMIKVLYANGWLLKPVTTWVEMRLSV